MSPSGNRSSPWRRVAITGLGPITPIGIGRAAFTCGLRQARSAVRAVSRFDPGPFPSQVAGEVDGFDPLDYLEAKRARRLDRFAQFAVAASHLALADARLDPATTDRSRFAICLGTALGGVAFGETQHDLYRDQGPRAVSTMLALSVFGAAGPGNVAIQWDLRGPALAYANGCAAGTVAVGEAARLIQRGDADLALAGGAEAPLAPLTFGSFALIRALSTRNDDPAHASRPFDRDRDGFVMAEGAAMLVLEEWGHAVRRGAPILAEWRGYGLTTDAHHMTAPRPDAAEAARAVTLALAESGLPPEAIGYVNAHGSSTPLNDPTETLALKSALGEAHARRTSVSGTKGYYGHALGASGAIEAAICCLALAENYLPPTVNLETPDPACDLDYIPGAGRETPVDVVLSTSFGFGGINAALVLSRAE